MARSSSASDRRLVWHLGAWLVLVLACSPQISQPELADLGDTLAAYESPRGVLSSDNVEELVATAAQRLRGLSLANPQQLILAVVDDLEPELEARGLVDSTVDERHSLSVDASLRLRVACPGPTHDEPDAGATFGSLNLVTRVDDNALAHVIQGQAHACTFPASEEAASSMLDGDIFLYRYDALSTQVADARFLLVVEGALSTTSAEGTELRNFDARLLGPSLELRLDVGGAEVIAFLDGETLGIRDARARYTCVLETRVCQAGDGATLTW